jgi:hypothetical protein
MRLAMKAAPNRDGIRTSQIPPWILACINANQFAVNLTPKTKMAERPVARKPVNAAVAHCREILAQKTRSSTGTRNPRNQANSRTQATAGALRKTFPTAGESTRSGTADPVE